MSTKQAVRERPIIFSGPMVRAILDGCKTQTRRIVRQSNSDAGGMPWARLEFDDSKVPQYKSFADDGYLHVATRPHQNDPQTPDCWARWRVYPRYEVGDRLWVRENFRTCPGTHVPGIEFADGAQISTEFNELDSLPRDWMNHNRLRPSIHMPRWASRLTLEVIDVRIERVCEIDRFDAKKEGAAGPNYVAGFCRIWDEIHGPGAWELNPWVWVISFKRL